jgi:hypothetical protein
LKSLTITEHTLTWLAAQPAVVAAVPALQPLAPRPAARQSCCGRGSDHRAVMRQVKQRLVGLPADQRALLKKALQADELVVYLPTRVVL